MEAVIKKKKYRGHYCWVCESILPNEKFSGKGHSQHICKKCAKLSKENLQKRTDKKFIYNILSQKNISIKNINRLASISKKYSGELGKQATILMKVAKLRPAKKKRIGFLYHKHKELFDELVRLGFIEDYITPCVQDDNEYERWLELQEMDHDVMKEKGEVEYKQEYPPPPKKFRNDFLSGGTTYLSI